MNAFAMQRARLLALIGLGILSGSLVIAYVAFWPEKHAPNPRFLAMLERIPAITSYIQDVTTKTAVGDRTLTITGTYLIDGPSARFSSKATTTLAIPNEGTHDFVLENISIGTAVYTRLTTTSSLLRESIPQSPEWQRFEKDSIPERWRDIAVSGPTLDILLLFRENGSYLEEIPDTDDDPLTLLYKLSSHAPRDAGGTLGTLAQRIGNGTVRLTIAESGDLERVEIASDGYSSDVHISNINSVPLIEAPIPDTGATLE